MSDTDYRYFEYQANEFAGRLLVPRADLIHEIDNSIEVLKRNDMPDYLKSDSYAVLSGITTRMARIFGVSSEVIERRVDKEKLWPPDFME
jgi:Zn-dependent peptidase ImmA (M78 family)